MNVHGSMEHVVIKHNLRYIDMIFDSKKDNNTALTHLPDTSSRTDVSKPTKLLMTTVKEQTWPTDEKHCILFFPPHLLCFDYWLFILSCL